jgi:acylphosphatase
MQVFATGASVLEPSIVEAQSRPDMDAAPAPDTTTCRVQVRGRVQGVGYRYSTVSQARALGLSGWVRNRADGSVEAVLQGPAPAVARMREWMRHQVPGARVDELVAQDLPAPVESFQGFEQRPTV